MPPINEDWAPGDLALCVDDRWDFGGGGQPRIGDRFIVSEVFKGFYIGTAERAWGLRLVGLTPARGIYGYPADVFRKVPPSAFEEPRVTSVSRPKRVAEDA